MILRKFTTNFKAKVVLKNLKVQHGLVRLVRWYEIHPTHINRDFFDTTGQRIGYKYTLLKAIDQLKVESDYLKDALR